MESLEQCIVVSTGMAAAGKTTICREIARRIPNAVYLDRDEILWGMMLVSPNEISSLPPFGEYVENDGVYPDHMEVVDTFSGQMIKVLCREGFYRRHVRDQSYLMIGRLTKLAIDLDKVVIIDSFLMRQVNNGTLQKFFEQEGFRNTKKRVIHFVADPEECYRRHLNRAKSYSKEMTLLRQELSVSRESFDKEFESKYQRLPDGLREVTHLVIDTTDRHLEDCVTECIKHIGG